MPCRIRKVEAITSGPFLPSARANSCWIISRSCRIGVRFLEGLREVVGSSVAYLSLVVYWGEGLKGALSFYGSVLSRQQVRSREAVLKARRIDGSGVWVTMEGGTTPFREAIRVLYNKSHNYLHPWCHLIVQTSPDSFKKKKTTPLNFLATCLLVCVSF